MDKPPTSAPFAPPRQITARSFKWEVYEDQDMIAGNGGFAEICIWCHTLENESTLWIVRDYPTHIYFQFPETLDGEYTSWCADDAWALTEALRFRLGDDANNILNYVPDNFVYRRVYYHYGPCYPMCKLQFKNSEAQRHAVAILRGGIKIQTRRQRIFGECLLSNIDTVRKLLTDRDLVHSGWMHAVGYEVLDVNRKVSTRRQEYLVPYNSIVQDKTIEIVPRPLWCSYDIEQYSHDHKAFPCPWLAEDRVYLITLVFFRDGEPVENGKVYAIMTGDCIIKDERIRKIAKIIKVKDELELIDTYADLIVQEDPDCVTGYNINTYDNKVLTLRKQIRGQAFPGMGRFVRRRSTRVQHMKWDSAAFKAKNLYLLLCEGRAIFDFMEHCIRTYNTWQTYSLDNAGKELIPHRKETHKLDLPAERQFEIFLAADQANERIRERATARSLLNPKHFADMSRENIIKIRGEGMEPMYELRHEWSNDEDTKPCLHPIFDMPTPPPPSLEEMQEAQDIKALEDMGEVVKYGVQDCLVVAYLTQEVKWWIGLLEMSNVCGLQLEQLLIRGTQARSLSTIYHTAMKMGVILNYREVVRFYFQGGLVQDPVVGIQELVGTIDFNSLYPNIMIWKNLCGTTLIRPDQYELYKDVPHEVFTPMICDEDPEDAEEDIFIEKSSRKSKKNKKDIVWRPMEVRFVKPEVCPGVIPTVLRQFLDARALVRKIKTDDPVYKEVLNGRQLALKVSANAVYGAMGAKKGKLPCLEIAAVTTDMGRRSITEAKRIILENFDCEIVYGDTDSLIIKLRNVPLEDLWKKMDEVAAFASAHFGGLRFEMEGIFNVLLVKHKHYVKWYYVRPAPGQPFRRLFVMGDNGKPKPEIKGLAPTRRDNCQWVRSMLSELLNSIMEFRSYYDIVCDFARRVVDLYNGRVPLEELIMTKNMGSNYKSDTAVMAVFAKRMLAKNQVVAPGQRHKFLVVEVDGSDKIGDKMILANIFSATPEAKREPIDYRYYFKNLAMKKIDTYLHAAFRDKDNILAMQWMKCKGGHIVDARTPAKYLQKCIEAPNMTVREFQRDMAGIPLGDEGRDRMLQQVV